MTSTTPTTFATTWKWYAVVHAQCEALSGKALSKAQDAEDAATDALIETRAGSPAEIAKTIDATEDYLRSAATHGSITAWSACWTASSATCAHWPGGRAPLNGMATR